MTGQLKKERKGRGEEIKEERKKERKKERKRKRKKEKKEKKSEARMRTKDHEVCCTRELAGPVVCRIVIKTTV